MKITPDMLRDIAEKINDNEEEFMCTALSLLLAGQNNSHYSSAKDQVKEFFSFFDVNLSGNLGFTPQEQEKYKLHAINIRVMFLEFVALYLEDNPGEF